MNRSFRWRVLFDQVTRWPEAQGLLRLAIGQPLWPTFRLPRSYSPGWEPVTRARASDATIHVERFGKNYLTVFNDNAGRHEATITTDDTPSEASRDLVSGMAVKWRNKSAAITLESESVAVIQLR
jgi:hypothetical protein